jgi:hypothetical protein
MANLIAFDMMLGVWISWRGSPAMLWHERILHLLVYCTGIISGESNEGLNKLSSLQQYHQAFYHKPPQLFLRDILAFQDGLSGSIADIGRRASCS